MLTQASLRDCALGAALLLAACLPTAAQDSADYPNRPIRVIVPVGAGAGIDNAARITAAAAEKHLGQKFVIENKPGGSQRVGTSMVAKSAPDGYTLLFTSPSPIVVQEFFPPKPDFDPAQDFQPVANGMFQPALLIVRPTLGVRSVDEFVAYAKKNPGKLSFGVQGIGGEMHLTLEHFKKTAGMDITPVPYNAGAQAIVDLLADRLDAMFLVVPPIKAHVDSGKLIALATLNARRIEALPNVPTMAEVGRSEMTGTIWFGYFAPSKTPKPIIDKLAHAFAQLRSDTALATRVAEMGAELAPIGPAEFARLIERDRARYGKIVKEGNLAKQN
ncbi:MAG: tripartite tricarboxylate transporter substrate binding protein [Xanthobacteraceae bacterium]|nr:tripartite tricarboxylate transporter substrate binding protein [Xanthobacteraceae bacterium]